MTRVPPGTPDEPPPAGGIPAGLRNDDPRLRQALPVELRSGGLRRIVPVAEIADQLSDQARSAIIEVARGIEAMTLEDALVDLLRAADAEFHSIGRRRRCEDRWLRAMALRIGLTGMPPMTLEEVGRRLGVTRERVRQVMAKHVSLPDCLRPYLPQIDRVTALLHDLAPANMEKLSERLQHEGLTGSRVSFDSLRAAAVFTGRALHVTTSSGLVVRDIREARAVLAAARKLTTRHGVFQVEQLADEVAIDGWKLTDEDTERYLRSAPDVHHLTGNYYLCPGVARNRLATALRTTLCLHQPMSLQAVAAATRRLYEWRNFGGGSAGREVVPPAAHAIRAFCVAQENYQVREEGGTCLIGTTEPLDWREVLGAESRIMVSVLDEVPHRILDRQTFLTRCEARGVRTNTAAVHLTYHPAFVRLGRNLWTLLGQDVPPEVIERFGQPIPRRPRRRR
ncbi:MAG TPA: sigma factor-like helix-turn-helix DNA-binding protein [Mycobacteriales bacterium]|nr:sigma factor-like helix-turn-helix DNA-binding protein [Mycobacteriales bacterium]